MRVVVTHWLLNAWHSRKLGMENLIWILDDHGLKMYHLALCITGHCKSFSKRCLPAMGTKTECFSPGSGCRSVFWIFQRWMTSIKSAFFKGCPNLAYRYIVGKWDMCSLYLPNCFPLFLGCWEKNREVMNARNGYKVVPLNLVCRLVNHSNYTNVELPNYL